MCLLQSVSCFDFSQYNCWKKHTLNPEITILYQFHDQKVLFKVPKIRIKIYFRPKMIFIQTKKCCLQQNHFCELYHFVYSCGLNLWFHFEKSCRESSTWKYTRNGYGDDDKGRCGTFAISNTNVIWWKDAN